MKPAENTHNKALQVRDQARALSPAQKERAQELMGGIQRNLSAIKDAFFEVGQALAELNNNKLYVALGHGTFAEMLEARNLMSQTQANKLIAVATLIPRESALRLGTEKSYALTRYAELVPEGGTIRALLKDGMADGKPLSTMTLRELEQAILELRSRDTSGKPNPEKQQARKAAREAQARLRKAGDGSAMVVSKRTRQGWLFQISVNEDLLQRLLRRL